MFPSNRNFFATPEDYRNRIFQNLSFDSPEEEQPPLQQKPPSFMDAYAEILNRKQGPAMDAYSKYLEQGFPDRQEYAPSKISRLAAILSGASAGFRNPSEGVSVTRSILDEPYNRAVEKYRFEGQRLKEGAALEEAKSRTQLANIDKITDNARQERKTESDIKAQEILNRSRELGMEKTQKELGLIGIETHTDPTTGNLIGY
jgi:hypothetical protein